jgi:hypothetical protein
MVSTGNNWSQSKVWLSSVATLLLSVILRAQSVHGLAFLDASLLVSEDFKTSSSIGFKNNQAA